MPQLKTEEGEMVHTVEVEAPAIAQHFVTFYSPGTFVAETNSEPVGSWNVNAAIKRARTILQRYNATPYGFRFTTRGRGSDDLDSREIAKSPFYWLGGRIETLAEVEARATDKDRILLSNMRSNGYDKIITNDNSWRWTQPFTDDDVRLDFENNK